MAAEKFYQVLDSDLDISYNSRDEKRFKTEAEAIAHAEARARACEEDHYVMQAIKVVGTPKAPLTVTSL